MSTHGSAYYFSGPEFGVPETTEREAPPAWDLVSPLNKLNQSDSTRIAQSFEESDFDCELTQKYTRHEEFLNALFEAEEPARRPLELIRAPEEDALDLELLTRQQIEEELLPAAAKKLPQAAVKFLRIKKKTSVKAAAQIIKYRKKIAEKRFNVRFNKEAKVLNKVRRTRLFWTRQSQAIPNVFRMVARCEDDEESYLEFLDFSKKEVLADELEDVPMEEELVGV